MVSRCFPGGYNVKLYISRGRLAWWLLAFLCCAICLVFRNQDQDQEGSPIYHMTCLCCGCFRKNGCNVDIKFDATWHSSVLTFSAVSYLIFWGGIAHVLMIYWGELLGCNRSHDLSMATLWRMYSLFHDDVGSDAVHVSHWWPGARG